MERKERDHGGQGFCGTLETVYREVSLISRPLSVLRSCLHLETVSEAKSLL